MEQGNNWNDLSGPLSCITPHVPLATGRSWNVQWCTAASPHGVHLYPLPKHRLCLHYNSWKLVWPLYMSSFMNHLPYFLWNWSPALLLFSLSFDLVSLKTANARLAVTEFCCFNSCWTFQNKPPNWISHHWPAAPCPLPGSLWLDPFLGSSHLSWCVSSLDWAFPLTPWKTWPINTVKIQYITFNIKYSLSGKISFCNFQSLFTLQKGTVNIILDLKEPV